MLMFNILLFVLPAELILSAENQQRNIHPAFSVKTLSPGTPQSPADLQISYGSVRVHSLGEQSAEEHGEEITFRLHNYTPDDCRSGGSRTVCEGGGWGGVVVVLRQEVHVL